MRLSRYVFALAWLLAGMGSAFSQEKLPEGARLKSLEVTPRKVILDGPFSYAQLLATATFEGGETADVTRMARIEAPASVSVSPGGIVRPVSNGNGLIAVTLTDAKDGKVTVPIAFEVRNNKSNVPVSYVTDVQPVLSKLGCNAGTCHGAQAGKNGFKLSLRGYDPLFDYRALTDDLEGRRFNRAAPEKSLMLMKPAGAVPHQGGVTMQAGDPNYEMIRRWISQGLKLDLDAPRVKSLDVLPKNPIISRIGQKQQFAVLASYTDGRVRDVTAEAFLESSNTEVATVDKTGLVTTVRRGESTMLVRYEGSYAASTVMIMGDRSGFQWEQRPVYNFIDELVDAKLKKVRVLPSPIAGDAEFIRRVYLDLTGMPPSAEEVRQFLNDGRDPKLKREELIDKLIGSDAFIEQWTNKWADLLMVNRKFLGDRGATAFRKWIRDAVASNKPYDQFAYEILTATGSNVDSPPASYFKILRSPDAVMENTTQLFLAVRFNCNKCHDHPFERWTQDQYYSLAAYFSQVSRAEDPKFKGQRIGGSAVEGATPLVEVIADSKGGEITHARTNATALPKFPYSVSTKVAPTDPRRVQAAKWITSVTNPYFAKSYVNRVWSYLLGVGLIEPVDDIRAGNPPTNPELLDRLTTAFIDSGFNVQKLIRMICKSRTYQLTIATNKWNRDDDSNYSHAVARRLSAEMLFDSIHKATGSQSHLPGLPAGARAAQLVDSNIELPGGFLELFSKPVRESSCECERSTGLNLGPILAMVNGPIVGEAIRDPNNHINRLVMTEKDDNKVVDEIYLSVLNRLPNAKEREAGVKAIHSAGADHAALAAAFKPKVDALEGYSKTLPQKQKEWETGLLNQKPTSWTTLSVMQAESKHGNPASAKPGATLTINRDGSILASGKTDAIDVYTLTGLAEIAQPITAIRLEALADPSLPAHGPGRAENGNFVLNEFRLSAKPLDKPDAIATPIKLTAFAQIFQQDGFPASNAVDGNLTTGWATSPRFGQDNAAIFRFQKPVSGPAGVAFTAVLDQRFGTAHVLGKFRLSVTTDPNPKLTSPVSPEQLALLETPDARRTAEQQSRLRAMYLAQDREYQRLVADTANPPPTDARVVGAQDLVWALINSPAFLFNH